MSNKKWTFDDIPNLKRKVIIITGGNSGLGYETGKALALKGAEVFLACRSTERGEAAREKILQVDGEGRVVVMELDLADLNSVRRFVKNYKTLHSKLDVLINNAGISMTSYFRTKDGFEGQMGINHLGHFALTALLSELLLKTHGSRVVNVSSNSHRYGKVDFENLLYQNGRDYHPLKAYGRSKLANLLFTYELQRRFERKGTDSIAVAAHPGSSQTNIGSHLKKRWWFSMFKPFYRLVTQSAEKGALCQLRAATDLLVKGGEYYGPDGFSERRGYPVRVESSKDSHNMEHARRLWEESEKLTGIKFNI